MTLMERTGKNCEHCGNPLEADTRRRESKRFCKDKCRYAGWKKKKEKELETLIRQLAGRTRL